MDGDYNIGPVGPRSGPVLTLLLSSMVPVTFGQVPIAFMLGPWHASRLVKVWTDGWGAPGDGGVLAWDEAGVAVGGGWFRRIESLAVRGGWLGPIEARGEDPEEPPELLVVVRRGHRGRGLGPRLLRAAVEEARRIGIPVLRMRVGDRMSRAAARRRILKPYASSTYRERGTEVFVIPTDPKKLSEAP